MNSVTTTSKASGIANVFNISHKAMIDSGKSENCEFMF